MASYLCRGQHDVPGVVVHAEVVYEEPRPDQVVEIVHDGTGQEQDLVPLLYEQHLTLDVQGLVHLLLINQLMALTFLEMNIFRYFSEADDV